MDSSTANSLKSGQISFGPVEALIKTGATGGLAVSRDAKLIAAGSQDKTVKIIDANSAKGTILRTLSGHTDGVTSVAFSPDASQVLSGSLDHTARLWDTNTGRTIKTFQVSNPVLGVAFKDEGKTAVVRDAKEVEVFDCNGDNVNPLKTYPIPE
jgi:WD40 repeat protein